MLKAFLVNCFLIFVLPGIFHAQTPGCTDPLATNYNASATMNDGSCNYPNSNVAPVSSFVMDAILPETSGLTLWNNYIWTHNDNNDTNLYALDTLNGNIISTAVLSGVTNTDWEEIAQDSNFVYVGDFGNNANGNRTNLKIYRINKASILNNSPVIDTISFTYADQIIFTPSGPNNTDFDCEAFIVGTDSIYLFTKQWVNNGTVVYSLPKIPGAHVAQPVHSFNVQGLITGATYLQDKQIVVLCGYSGLLQPFVYLLYDFYNNNFFDGNKRKVNVTLPFHQMEGIASADGLKYYLSNEYFSQPPIINVTQKLHVFDLSGYLLDYITGLTSNITELTAFSEYLLYPNPTNGEVRIKNLPAGEVFKLTDLSGHVLFTGTVKSHETIVSVSGLPEGVYLLQLINDPWKNVWRIVKQ